jgi:hypothetical protein
MSDRRWAEIALCLNIGIWLVLSLAFGSAKAFIIANIYIAGILVVLALRRTDD